jgi:hypothetical protein
VPLDDHSKESQKNVVFRVIENGDENHPFTDEIAKALISLWVGLLPFKNSRLGI